MALSSTLLGGVDENASSFETGWEFDIWLEDDILAKVVVAQFLRRRCSRFDSLTLFIRTLRCTGGLEWKDREVKIPFPLPVETQNPRHSAIGISIKSENEPR